MQTLPVEIRVYRSIKTLDWKLLPTKLQEDAPVRVSYGDWVCVEDQRMRAQCKSRFQGFIDAFSSTIGGIPSAFDRMTPSQRRKFFSEHVYISVFYFPEASELEIEPIAMIRGGNGIGLQEHRKTIKWSTSSPNLYRYLSEAAGVL